MARSIGDFMAVIDPSEGPALQKLRADSYFLRHKDVFPTEYFKATIIPPV